MNKSKFMKILIAVLSFCLLIGTLVGVTAFAEEGEADSVEYTAPAIVSKNVEYSSQTYLHYAVPVASIPEADRVEGGVWLRICNADGTLAYNQLPEEGTKMVNGIECYTFKGRGVPAKELNTVELTQVETKSGAKSEVCSYSVEEYLYQKLYKEGYAAKTEEDTGLDGKDYKRRTLYYDLLKYGAIAQELLAPSASNKIGDTAYAIAPDAVASLGKFDKGTNVVLRAKDSVALDMVAWEFVHYDAFGEVLESGYAADGAIFTLDGYLKATPVIGVGSKETFNSGSLPSNIAASSTTTRDNVEVGSDPVDETNNVLKITPMPWVLNADGSYSKTSVAVNFDISASEENADVFVFETMLYSTTTNFTYEVTLRVNSDKAANRVQFIYFNSTNATLYKNGGGDVVKKNDGLGKNAWHSIRVEYRVLEQNGVKVPETKLILNGEVAAVSNELYGTGYYTNGVLNNASVPSPNDIKRVVLLQSNSSQAGNTFFDDVLCVHRKNIEANYVSPEAQLVDFNSGYASSLGIASTTSFVGTTFGEENKNTWGTVYDEATGDGHLLINKFGVDNSGTSWNGGVSLSPKVTYTEEGYNTLVMEADLYMENVKSYASEIIICENGKTKTADSPFIFTIPKVYNEWLHIVVTYRPTKVDESGKVLEFESSITYNGIVYDIKSGTAADAYGANIKNGTTQIPAINPSIYFKFAFNNSFNGVAKVDNIGIKLLNVDGKAPAVVTE